MPPLRLILVALIAVSSMSLVPVLIKATSANEVTIGLVRLAIALSVISPLLLWRRELAGVTKRQWQQLLCIGLVFGVHWLLYFASIKLATAVIAAAAVATYGVQYLALAWWFNGERIGVFECLAMLVAFSGCVVMVPEFSLNNTVALGIVCGVVSGFFYAVLPLLHQRASALNTLQRSWGQFSFALLCFVPLAPLANWDLQASDWYRLAALGVVCTLISHSLWIKATTELPALFSSVIYYLYVPLAMLSSSVFLNEAISSEKLFGVSLILLSSIAITLYRWRRVSA